MQNKKIFNIAVFSGFALIVLIMFRGAFQSGTFLFGHDAVNIYLPFRFFAKDAMLQYGQMPVWMPNIFMGIPLISSSSLLYFYPTNFLFMLLPVSPEQTLTPDIIIHMFAAAWGTYLFLKNLNLNRASAVFGASAFMISGFIISYIIVGHWNNIKAGCLIPFVFYFIHRGVKEKKLHLYLSSGIFMALQIMATGMQIMAYTYVGLIMYVLYLLIFSEKEKNNRIRIMWMFALTTIAAIIFSAPQFFPSMQYKDFSWRGDFSYSDFISWSFNPKELITLILPKYFGLSGSSYWGHMKFNLTSYYFGIIPLILSSFAFIGKRFRNKALFFSAASAVMFVLSFGGFTPLYKILYHIPVFNQFRNPSRFIYVVTFFIIILSSIGLHNIIESVKPEKIKRYLTVLSVSLTSLFLLLFILINNGVINGAYRSIKNTEMPAGLMATISNFAKSDLLWFFVISVLFIMVLYLYFSKKIKNVWILAGIMIFINFTDVYRIDKEFIRYDKFENYVSKSDGFAQFIKKDRSIFRLADFNMLWGPNKGVYHGVETVNGIHGLIPSSYMNMMNAGLFNNVVINRAFNIKYYMMNSDVNIPDFQKIADTGRIKLYQDTKVMDRVFFADRVKIFADNNAVLSGMKVGLFDPAEVMMTVDPKIGVSEAAPSTVTITDYKPDRVEIEVEAGKDGMVVISNLYYNKWKAEVDGKKSLVYNVNYAMCGIKAEKGTHRVVLYYSRTLIYLSLMIFFAAIAGFIILVRKKI